jgi:hypothetical protein
MRLARRAALSAAMLLATAPGALAQSYVPWTDPLPPASQGGTYSDPRYEDLCPDGPDLERTRACVQETIDEMRARYDALLASCDHRGPFALAYLRTTEEYQRASLEPGFFDDPAWVDHEDTIFAQLYFDAYDDWEAGRRDRVPEAWRIAFEAAEQRSVTGTGDVLLGISAHINRDLAYTLAISGLVDPDTGASRKPDHDAVNAFLARVPDPLFRELRAVWDPSITWYGGPQGPAAIAVVQAWREAAWRYAERLVSARSAEERRAVEESIERYAAAQGRTILEATRYRAGDSSAARDAHCASQAPAPGAAGRARAAERRRAAPRG